MQALARTSARIVRAFGFDLRHFARALRGLGPFAANLVRYRYHQASAPTTFRVRARHMYPVLVDRYERAGEASGHYFHQDLWAARHVFVDNPPRHYDVGSRIDGFIAHLLSFRGEVYVFDIRGLDSRVTGLHFVRGNATALPLPDASVHSISCLHAAEHFGLGRYGDSIDPQASFTAAGELKRVLAPGGRLYFSVPIGRERLEFDAHRVFAPATVLSAFAELELVEFAAVDDEGGYRPSADPGDYVAAHYSCGLFLYKK